MGKGGYIFLKITKKSEICHKMKKKNILTKRGIGVKIAILNLKGQKYGKERKEDHRTK